MRNCVSCGAADRSVETSSGTEHWVKPEVKWIKKPEDVTPQLVAKGWAYKFFQGRHAMVRMACVDCLRKSAEVESQLKQYRKLAAAAERKDEENYYMALCQ